MSAATKKPPVSSNPRRISTEPSSSPATPRRTPTTPATPTTNGAGHARSRSIRAGAPVSARAAMARSGSFAGTSKSTTSKENPDAEDEARAETVALLEELKERLRKTETVSEQFQKQAQVLQSRLDEALVEQNKLEERLHEGEERTEALENEKRDIQRQRREMEAIYEAERSSMTREKEEMANREEEMQDIIERLKENISQRANGDDGGRLGRQSNTSSPNLEQGHFAPPSAVNRSDSRNNSKLLLQKDKLIESLRLELAEAQIKLVETENMGGGRLHEVERLLLETRMTNARLMEDNESFQLLLSEKTLNGDFKTDFGFSSSSSNTDALNALEGRPATSLADELSDFTAEDESDNYRRLEAELKAAKDQNKALTLYINKIIERLLQHQDFESILDQSADVKPANNSNTEKELPPPPPKASGASVLQRAKSVAMGSGKTRPRPMSQLPASHSALTDPNTAPSIPFGLGRASTMRQGRPKSDQYTGGAARVVNQMYRGPGGATSPPLTGPRTPRHSGQSFFTPSSNLGNPNAAARVPSGNSVPTLGNFPGASQRSETSSLTSAESGEIQTPSPPRPGKTTTFAGNKPKPLRLVQDAAEAKADEERASKRASWMGWAFGGKKDEVIPDEAIRE